MTLAQSVIDLSEGHVLKQATDRVVPMAASSLCDHGDRQGKSNSRSAAEVPFRSYPARAVAIVVWPRSSLTTSCLQRLPQVPNTSAAAHRGRSVK